MDVAQSRLPDARACRWDRARGAVAGVIETGAGGFALIIAIQVFQAPDTVKSLVAGAGPLGLLLNPISLSFFSRWNVPASKIAGAINVICGALLGVAMFSNSLWSFLVPTCLAFALSAQTMPLLLHTWTSLYPGNLRGSYLSVSLMFGVASTLCFSLLGGWVLDRDVAMFRWVLGCIALAYVAAGIAISRLPSTSLGRMAAPNPLTSLSYAISDWKFGVMLIAWMFLGFGNLMLLPLRFEYLLQPEYGIEASKLTVTTLTLAVPALFHFLSSRLWGRLFDRLNFLTVRIAVNVAIMLSIALFFSTREVWVMALGAATLGVAMGGANISWSLWVTKFAPPDRTAAYMSVHTFTTGIRGIASPFLGFYLIGSIGAMETGVVGCGLILVSIILVAGLYRARS